MIIVKKRVRGLEKYLSFLKNAEKFYIGIKSLDKHKARLFKVGFTNSLEIGETVLPSFLLGPICSFNAIGEYYKLRNEPLETVYREGEWRWKDWGGHEHSKLVDIPYKRYPRRFISPQSIELQIRKDGTITCLNPLSYVKEEYEEIKHVINLFLEIFGECEIFRENFDSYTHVPIKRLNWEVLPVGKYPWVKLNAILIPVLNRVKPGNRPVVTGRLEMLSSKNPNFVALGKSGFSGYIIYGFENINMFVLESLYYGNATYIFEKNWEELSKMSKADILKENLQFARIIHTSKWGNGFNKLFNEQSSLFNQSA
jgi:hypothetical protein